MRIALRLLVMLATIWFVARPADAHTIVIRDGGTSTDLCAGFNTLSPYWAAWISLGAEDSVPEGTGEFDGDPAGEESINNNCGVNITSLDIQLSEDATFVSHPPDSVEAGEGSVFDTLQVVDTAFGDALRFFSSEGNFISCGGSCSVDLFLLLSTSIGPEFIFEVDPDLGDPFGYFRILDFNEPTSAVPEPATILLLGAGLGGMALRRRRRV